MAGKHAVSERAACEGTSWPAANPLECAAWQVVLSSTVLPSAWWPGNTAPHEQGRSPCAIAFASRLRAVLPQGVNTTLRYLCSQPLAPTFWSVLREHHATNDSQQHLFRAAIGAAERTRLALSYWEAAPMCFYGPGHRPGLTKVIC